MILGFVFTASGLIYLASVVIQCITNYTRRESMSKGGKKFLILTNSQTVVTAVLLAISVILAVMQFGGHDFGIIVACLDLISAYSCLTSLKLRKRQYEGIMAAMSNVDLVRRSHNNMMSNVSHEIRTPLNTILGLSEILLHKEEVNGKIAEDIRNISDAGSNLFAVINNVIDLSKFDAGKFEIIENDYSTRDMITEVIKRSESMLKDTSVEFLADIDSNIPSKLHGDNVRIIQALSNVLSNSCKFTHIGVVTFRVSCLREGQRAFLRFDVEDTGVGIKEDEQRDIFSICSEPTKESKLKGAGLGLVITKCIIDLMNGKISFTSEEGQGTCFTIELMQRIVDPNPVGSMEDKSSIKPDSKYMFTAPMARILVVDDNMVNLFVAKELLSNYEIDVTTASSGQECLDLVSNNYYDVIFMDYVMPEMDGHETLVSIRAKDNDYFKKIPVVALTAQIVPGAEKTYIEEGFQGYISKPININDLEASLLKLLPEEYICYKQADSNQGSEGRLEDKAWFKRFTSVLLSFDVKKGLAYSNNDYTSYLNLLRVIYNDSFNQAAKLRSYIESSNYDAYRVAVHALKSVTASAGADKLSFICQEHENAAKNADGEYIRNHIGTLLSEYDVFLKEIETVLQRESEMMNRSFSPQKTDVSPETINEIAVRLLAALEDYNIDDSEACVKELEAVNLHPSQEKALRNISDMLLVFKYDEAADIVQKVFTE